MRFERRFEDRTRAVSAAITMRSRPPLLRSLLVAWLGVPLALSPSRAYAKDPPTPRACAATLKDAQEHERAGHLLEAKDLYLKCARATCGLLQKRCAAAASETNSGIPRVAFVVNDSEGAPLVDVLVKMDGQSLATRLDGRAVALDPGVHEFTFGARLAQPARFVWLTRKLMIAEGQRGPMSITLPPARPEQDVAAETSPSSGPAPADPPTAVVDPAKDPEPAATEKAIAEEATHDAPSVPADAAAQKRGASLLPWTIGGVGILGLGAGGLLTYWGATDNAALAQCKPNCPASSLDHTRQMYVASDIAFGVGGAAIGLATVLFFSTRHHEGSATAGTSAPRGRSALVVDLQPARVGGMATIGGTF